jgi:hypothetical protein
LYGNLEVIGDLMLKSYINILNDCCGLPPSSDITFPGKKIQSRGNKYDKILVKCIWQFLNSDQTKQELQVRDADQVTREKWEIAG